MNNSLPISLSNNTVLILLVIVLVLVIVGPVLLRLIGKRRKHPTRARAAQSPTQKTTHKIDHGLRVAKRHGTERSPLWPAVALAHRLKEPACMACGHKTKLQVHHIKPFHLHPKLELDPKNLITLCEADGRDHHLLLGHLDEWESYNVNVRDDVKRYRNKTAAQIKADAHWQKLVLNRP
jgi:hypothetical protein